MSIYDTATSPNWAVSDRPIRRSRGVYHVESTAITVEGSGDGDAAPSRNPRCTPPSTAETARGGERTHQARRRDCRDAPGTAAAARRQAVRVRHQRRHEDAG